MVEGGAGGGVGAFIHTQSAQDHICHLKLTNGQSNDGTGALTAPPLSSVVQPLVDGGGCCTAEGPGASKQSSSNTLRLPCTQSIVSMVQA